MNIDRQWQRGTPILGRVTLFISNLFQFDDFLDYIDTYMTSFSTQIINIYQFFFASFIAFLTQDKISCLTTINSTLIIIKQSSAIILHAVPRFIIEGMSEQAQKMSEVSGSLYPGYNISLARGHKSSIALRGISIFTFPNLFHFHPKVHRRLRRGRRGNEEERESQ